MSEYMRLDILTRNNHENIMSLFIGFLMSLTDLYSVKERKNYL